MSKQPEGILMIGLIVVGAIGIIGWALPGSKSSPGVPLGVWNSFPLASQCSAGNYTAPQCELIGNTTYRTLLSFNNANIEGGVRLSISVGCTAPSNTVGAFLQLQYANYSLNTHLNTSNFVDLSSTVKIDNSANNPCPGNLIGPQAANLPKALQAVIFRIVGSAGGGPGDNPRFSSIVVNVYQTALPVLVFQPLTITSTSFIPSVRTPYALGIATTVTFQWIATNVTATSCISLAACLQHGSGTCSITAGNTNCNGSTITFSPAFNAAPNVVGSISTSLGVFFLLVGSLSFLQAQTITV